jgi:hypothetical protein
MNAPVGYVVHAAMQDRERCLGIEVRLPDLLHSLQASGMESDAVVGYFTSIETCS